MLGLDGIHLINQNELKREIVKFLAKVCNVRAAKAMLSEDTRSSKLLASAGRALEGT